jgi:hypothetical protein
MPQTAISNPLQILKLRLLVGFLGEQRQANWWGCGFLSPTGIRFLQTTFPRTAAEAALRSTTEAARLLHDSRIGRTRVFHLFRLPLAKEDILESLVREVGQFDVSKLTAAREAAMAELGSLSKTRLAAPPGPVQVGVAKDIFTPAAISGMAAHYHSALAGDIQCFPYFAGESNGRR